MIDTKKLREAIAIYGMDPSFISNMAKLIDELDRVTAERDALKVDAERYRWLRDIGDEKWQPFSRRAGCTGPLIDKAIDAAIRASEGDA